MKSLLAAAALIAVTAPAAAQQMAVPTWRPLARTATSAPLSTVVPGDLAALRQAPRANVVDLGKLGYVEEEFLLTAPAYTTRILLRRPVDAKKFSGTVAVEPLPDGTEWPAMWTAAWPQLVRHGDVWVGVTVSRDNLDSLLRKSDAARYGALKIADEPARFAILAETGALLRSADGPLGKPGLLEQAGTLKGVLQLFGVGWGTSGCTQAQFINEGYHAKARRADGRPIYTGYLIGGCASGPQVKVPGDAPVIAIATESDYRPGLAEKTVKLRQPDGNKPGENRSRWYEIAGAAQSSWLDQPNFALSLHQAGVAPTPAACPKPPSRLPGRDDFLRGALFDLDLWTRMGIAAPAGKQFELNADGTLKRDENGNVEGGVQPHWVEVATATLTAGSEGKGFCAEVLTEKPLEKNKLAKLYKSKDDYAVQVANHLDQLVGEHRLAYDDAKAELDQAKARGLP
jgi:hypothetical protein